MKAVDWYRTLLESLDAVVEEDGSIYLPESVGKSPLMVEIEKVSKPVFLPTDAVLRDYDKTRQVLFHPLSEFVTVGESDIFKLLKMLVRLALITRITTLVETLAILGTSTEFHGRFNSNQLKLLEAMAGIDEKSVAKFRSVLQKGFTEDPTLTTVSLFMTRDDTLGEVKYPRVCNVAFPITGVLNKAYTSADPSRKVLDVDVRKKTPDDIKIWLGLLNYTLPGIEEKGTYSRGSDHYAPYLGALLESYFAVQSRLNEVLSEFSSFIITTDVVKLVDLKWYGVFKSGSVFNDLPNLSGNKGGMVEAPKPKIPPKLFDSTVVSAGPPAEETIYRTQQPLETYHYDTPQQQHHHEEQVSNGGMSVAEWRRLTAEKQNAYQPHHQPQRASSYHPPQTQYRDPYGRQQPSYPQNNRPLSASDLIR